MRFIHWLVGGCVSAAMIFVAIPLQAEGARQCPIAEPNAQSYTWDFHHEANTIFQDLQSDIWQIEDQAGYLQRSTDLNLTWKTSSGDWNRMRDAVNDMSDHLCRLEGIRRVLAPWQQKVVDRIASDVPLMVNNTEDAIVYANSNPSTLWNPTYQSYVNYLERTAETLNQTLGSALHENLKSS